jgi:condensin-2 complex subunit G2
MAAKIEEDKKKKKKQSDPVVSQSKAVLAHADFLKTVQQMHDILLQLGICDEGKVIQSQISTICEKLYCTFPEDEKVRNCIPNTMVYLLAETFPLGAKKNTVKRVYNMRKALRLLDYSEVTILQQLLLRAVASSLYLSSTDGVKFIICAFNADPLLPALLHSAIVPQIPSSHNNIIQTYGEIYYKAWSKAEGQTLLKIEHDCIQDLMYHAIHARNDNLFGKLRIILNAFHAQKNQKGVDEMLLRLYEPILFRCLSVANSIVRRNAVMILSDSFPLRNPESNRTENDRLLEKQISDFKTILFDECPQVREMSIEGLSRVLTVYWEIISSDDVFWFLKKLASKLAYDATSPDVRIAVCKGLMMMLDNHLAQPSLKSKYQRMHEFYCDTLFRNITKAWNID